MANLLRERTFLFSKHHTPDTAVLHILVDSGPKPDPDTARLLVGMRDLGLELEDLQAIRPTLQLGEPT